MIYISIICGYKVGGINFEVLVKVKDEGLNLDVDFFVNYILFVFEYFWSGEFGVKGSLLDDKFVLCFVVFYMYCEDM